MAKTEYRHLLSGNWKFVTEGKTITRRLKLPPNIVFSDSFLFQIGIGEKTIEDAKNLEIELWQWYNSKNINKII